ncbi:MAG: endonuclease/exonuclease/phosphatase family protein [Candidatus Omnitrophica bacterium]|nr:endonuclease/exonuclease/phosphatase family protein [Candidatus Omnitrophota bacterium]
MAYYAVRCVMIISLLLGGCCFTPYRFNYLDEDRPRYLSSTGYRKGISPGKNIKVVSYNIKYSRHPEALRLFKKEISLSDADIICLQEMDIKSVKEIASYLDYNYVYYPSSHSSRCGRDFGPAILSKFPIEKTRKIMLPPYQEKKMYKIQRIAVIAQITLDSAPLTVVSTHLGVFISPDERITQAETILDALDGYPAPYIIAGDFNTFNTRHRKAVSPVLAQAGFSLATSCVKWTYKHWYLFNKKALYDYIFVKGAAVKECGYVADLKASDHMPIWAVLALP